MSDMLLSWRFESRSKKGTVFRNWMRSNSGLERFQRPSVSHNNLSAMSFRPDICYQCVETTPASRLNQECSLYDAILETIEEQFQSKTSRRLGRHLLLNHFVRNLIRSHSFQSSGAGAPENNVTGYVTHQIPSRYGLESHVTSWFYCHVAPAEDDLTSLSAIGGNAHHGPAG